MTSPFQSILHAPGTNAKPANDDHMSLEDMIAGAFSRASSSHSSTATGGQSASLPSGSQAAPNRPPLTGGEYSKGDALDLLNAHFLVGKSQQETAIFRINADGTLSFVPADEFRLAVQNIFVNDGGKLMPAEKCWRASSTRHEKWLVF